MRSSSHASAAWISAISIFAAGLILYLSTLVDGVQTADSGELQWVAATLGLAHPPGFPLYTLIGHLFTRLPLALTTGGKVALFSTLIGAATLSITFWSFLVLTEEPEGDSPSGSEQRIDSSKILAGIFSALILATSTTFWAQATTANIRSLTTLFAALGFLSLFLFARSPRRILAPAFILGLGLTHHLSLAFMVLIMGVWVVWVGRAQFRIRSTWAWLGLAAIVSLLPLLYLPWRDPALRSWPTFLRYALGLGFQGDFFYFRTAGDLWARLGVMLNVLQFQFASIILVAALLGWFLLLARQPRPAALLGGTFALHTLITATYRAPQTVEYMLPAYIPLALCGGYFIFELLTLLAANHPLTPGFLPRRRLRGLILVFFIALFAVPIRTGIERYRSFHTLSQTTDTQDYTQKILSEAPREALVLADWHWYSALKYQQEVDGRRPDLEIEFLFPRSADYGADWAARVKAGLDQGRSVITTHFDEEDFRLLPPYQALGEAFLFPNSLLEALPTSMTPTADRLGSLSMEGFRLHPPPTTVDASFAVELAFRLLPSEPIQTDLHLLAILIDAAGRPVAQIDLATPIQPAGMSIARLPLTPFTGTPPGRYQLHIGAYFAGKAPLATAAGETTIMLGTFDLAGSPWRPTTGHPVYWTDPAASRTLRGYDWDATLPGLIRLNLHWQLTDGSYWTEIRDLPPQTPVTLTGLRRWGMIPAEITLRPEFTHYVPLEQGIVWLGSRPALDGVDSLSPGTAVRVHQEFAAERPILRDLGLATRLIGLAPDGFAWAWLNPDPDSDIPAMGAIPTLKWIAGSRIDHPRTLTVGETAVPGQQIEGFLRPYDVFTNRPLAILDARIANRGQPWIPFDRAIVLDP